MFGIIFIFYIGRYYYRLAEEFKRSPWLYAIIGIAVYYASSIILATLIAIALDVANPGYIDNASELGLGLIGIPFGIAGCYACYKYLEKKWKNNYTDPVAEINEIGKKSLD